MTTVIISNIPMNIEQRNCALQQFIFKLLDMNTRFSNVVFLFHGLKVPLQQNKNLRLIAKIKNFFKCHFFKEKIELNLAVLFLFTSFSISRFPVSTSLASSSRDLVFLTSNPSSLLLLFLLGSRPGEEGKYVSKPVPGHLCTSVLKGKLLQLSQQNLLSSLIQILINSI